MREKYAYRQRAKGRLEVTDKEESKGI